MTPAHQIAEKLTEAQRRAVVAFDGQWVAGPTLAYEQLDAISALRSLELLDREFADEGPARQSVGDDVLHIRLSACWHFRLTPLGLAVRAHLLSKESER